MYSVLIVDSHRPKPKLSLHCALAFALYRHFKALFNRGFALDKLQKYEEAIRDYTAAIALDPANAFAYYNRGISRDR